MACDEVVFCIGTVSVAYTIELEKSCSLVTAQRGVWCLCYDRWTMTNSEIEQPVAYPTNWIAREDLLSCRPDLPAAIANLEDWEIEHIANKVGDQLTEAYWLAMEILLNERFGDSSEAN